MNEQLAAIKAQAEGGHLDVMVIAKADVLAMLAEVERLTGEVAEYKAGREDLIQTGLSLVADRSRFRSAILSLTPGGSEFHDSPERCAEWARERMASAAKLAKERNELRAEVERLTGELARLRNGGKPEPTQEENDAAQERLRQMDVLHARHGNNTSTWPDYALEHYNRLQGAQNDYEAKYC